MKQHLVALLRDVRVVVISVIASVMVIGGTSATTMALSASHTTTTHATLVAPASTPKTGTVYTGEYAVFGAQGAGNSMGTFISLPKKLKYKIAPNRYTIVNGASTSTSNCPGVGKVATTGWVCIYQASYQTGPGYVYDPKDEQDTTSNLGFVLYFATGSGGNYSQGYWAVKVGSKSTSATTAAGKAAHRPVADFLR